MKHILKLYRFIKGFITIKVSGGFPERFLNLCNKEKLYVWDVVYENNFISLKIYCRDFRKLRKIRLKSGVSIKITDKKGIHFTLRENRKRKILIVGLLVSLLFMNLTNLFVWSIEVKNTENIGAVEIREAVKSLGLDFGTFVPLYDEIQSGREAVNLFNGKVIWAAINIKGSKATVEMREYFSFESKKDDNNSPCNITADFGGIIISEEVYSGVAAVNSGSAVKKGDILISGISENTDGSVNFHHADGSITALHSRTLSHNVSSESVYKTVALQDSFNIVNIFSLKIPLSYKAFYSKDFCFVSKEFLKVNDSLLPFGIISKSKTAVTEAKSSDIDIIYCIDEFTKAEYNEFKNTYIINCDYKISSVKSGYNINGNYNCIDFIGKKSAILQEN